MKRVPAGFCAIGICVFFALGGQGAEPPSPSADESLKKLRDSDPEVRVEAVRNLQTSMDPRIPEAMLPLLSDEGNSIRRLAARAVGSRWWQIPEDRRPAYLAGLKRNAGSASEDERNMGERGLGLLTRSYKGGNFARSADGRWVVYERYCLPCLIDTKNGTEELLGWSPDDRAWLISSWGNGPAAESILWHPRKAIVAFSMLLNRRDATLWIWRERGGLRKITVADALGALGLSEGDILGAGGFGLEAKGWDGDVLRCEMTYSTMKGEEIVDHSALLGWDAGKDTLKVFAREKQD